MHHALPTPRRSYHQRLSQIQFTSTQIRGFSLTSRLVSTMPPPTFDPFCLGFADPASTSAYASPSIPACTSSGASFPAYQPEYQPADHELTSCFASQPFPCASIRSKSSAAIIGVESVAHRTPDCKRYLLLRSTFGFARFLARY